MEETGWNWVIDQSALDKTVPLNHEGILNEELYLDSSSIRNLVLLLKKLKCVFILFGNAEKRGSKRIPGSHMVLFIFLCTKVVRKMRLEHSFIGTVIKSTSQINVAYLFRL